MKICMCGKTGESVTTTCDKCIQPLCRGCAVIITPKITTGDIEIKHMKCMPKKYQEAKKNE